MSDGPPDLRALRVLVVDDEEGVRFALTTCLESGGHRVVARGSVGAADGEVIREAFDVAFVDADLMADGGWNGGDWPAVVVIVGPGEVDRAATAVRSGAAADYLERPVVGAAVRLVAARVAGRRQLDRRAEQLGRTLAGLDPEAELPTANRAWREGVELARRVAPTAVAVLVRGEPGSGRGRVGRAIHRWSWRAGGPVATVDCRGKSADALELELFGDDDRPGVVPACHGGTLVLADVIDAPLAVQPRLAGLIRDREYDRPGWGHRRSVDVRVVATAADDPYAAAAAGRVREDLLAAVSVVQVAVPPLRHRPEDVPLLAGLYLAHFAPGARFTAEAWAVLAAHRWPGNGREVRVVVEQAVLRSGGGTAGTTVDVAHLPADLLAAVTGGGPPLPTTVVLPDPYRIGDLVPLSAIERSHIRRVMASVPTIRRAAHVLGINASTLCRKLKQMRQADAAAAGMATGDGGGI